MASDANEDSPIGETNQARVVGGRRKVAPAVQRVSSRGRSSPRSSASGTGKGTAPTPAIVIEALPAAYGDTVLVSCAFKNRTWRLLVDAGTDECWPSLKRRFRELPVIGGKRHIDLAVVTHIDHDHIGAAHALFDDRSLGLTFGDIWFNAPAPASTVRGVAEGRSLASLLGARQIELPWNKAWGGQAAVTTAGQPFVELPSRPNEPRLTLLSPTTKTLAALFKVWAKELQKLGQSEKPAPKPPALRGVMNLEDLASRATPLDRAPANGSSIAMLLEHEGHSVLLAADAYAPVLVDALRALAKHRGVALPWQLDVFKLSHHCSSANITVDLLGAIQARHYIVSTNGAIFNHPDDEAVARVILNGGKQRSLWFNYRNERSERWDAADLKARYGYAVGLPADDKRGTVIAMHRGSVVSGPGSR